MTQNQHPPQKNDFHNTQWSFSLGHKDADMNNRTSHLPVSLLSWAPWWKKPALISRKPFWIKTSVRKQGETGRDNRLNVSYITDPKGDRFSCYPFRFGDGPPRHVPPRVYRNVLIFSTSEFLLSFTSLFLAGFKVNLQTWISPPRTRTSRNSQVKSSLNETRSQRKDRSVMLAYQIYTLLCLSTLFCALSTSVTVIVHVWKSILNSIMCSNYGCTVVKRRRYSV